MRKNDVRKWIHAGLDLLPLLIIPIFALAVRSDNNYQPIEITTGGYEYSAVFETNVVEDTDDLYLDRIYHLDYIRIDNGGYGLYFDFMIYQCESMFIEDTNEYVDETSLGNYVSDTNNYILFSYNDNEECFFQYSNSKGYASVGIFYDYVEFTNIDFLIYNNASLDAFKEYLDAEGYLPSASEYNVYQYVYNEGVVYNDTDVGSQMIYTLYNSCDKYFNFNNVFNFKDIYQWLEVNVFGGSAPLSAFIAWNIFLYEFIMDLIFLLYALFMFFIDFCTNLIDRFHTKCSGGK